MTWSQETLEIMKNAGWYEGRSIDISEFVEGLEQLGYVVFEEVQKFLKEFGDLIIDDTVNGEYHETTVISSYRKPGSIRQFEQYAQERLVPVGIIDSGHIVMLVSESGKVYICSVGKKGNNAAEAWENLIMGKFPYKGWR